MWNSKSKPVVALYFFSYIILSVWIYFNLLVRAGHATLSCQHHHMNMLCPSEFETDPRFRTRMTTVLCLSSGRQAPDFVPG